MPVTPSWEDIGDRAVPELYRGDQVLSIDKICPTCSSELKFEAKALYGVAQRRNAILLVPVRPRRTELTLVWGSPERRGSGVMKQEGQSDASATSHSTACLLQVC